MADDSSVIICDADDTKKPDAEIIDETLTEDTIMSIDDDPVDTDPTVFKALYDNLDVDENNRSNRLNAIHIRGVNDMSTEDIMEYFKDFKFDSIEWINDNSCNVVWDNEALAAKAMISKNKSIIKQDKQVSRISNDGEEEDSSRLSTGDEDEKIMPPVDENKDNDDEKSESTEVQKLGIPVPPGHWVVGFPHDKSRGILMRFALKSDRKVPGAEKRSQYYLKYGNPNYGGMVGLISKSKKRSYRETFSNNEDIDDSELEPEIEETLVADPKPDIEIRNKMPKMRMYADEESQKKKLKKSVLKERTPVGDLRNKLSSRNRVVTYDETSEHEDTKPDGDLRAKLKQRAKVRPVAENSEDESDLRKKLNQMRRRKQRTENLIIELPNNRV